MLTIKLVLTAIAIAIGAVFAIVLVIDAIKKIETRWAYFIVIGWIAVGEAFYIRYFIELLEAKQ